MSTNDREQGPAPDRGRYLTIALCVVNILQAIDALADDVGSWVTHAVGAVLFGILAWRPSLIRNRWVLALGVLYAVLLILKWTLVKLPFALGRLF